MEKRYLEQNLVRDSVHDIDFHGRRIVNAQRSRDSKDYVIREELEEVVLGTALLVQPDDTDIPPEVLNLSVKRTSDVNTIAGNEFEVWFDLPTSQLKTYDGYVVVLHTSNTLPTSTTYDTGSFGQLIKYQNILSDLTKAYTTNELAGKDIVIFSNKRNAVPTHDYEASILLAPIISNTDTQITFNWPYLQPYELTGLEYYIVDPGDHWYDKVKYYTPFQQDRFGPDTRKLKFASGVATLYAWAILRNYWGFGEVGSPATRTYEGIATDEIKLLAVDNGRIASLAVTFDKINVNELSAIASDVGLLTAGIIRAVTFETSATNPKVRIDSVDGLTVVDSSGNLMASLNGNFISIQSIVPVLATNQLAIGEFSNVAGISVLRAGSSALGITEVRLNGSGVAGGSLIDLKTSGNSRLSITNTAVTAAGSSPFTGPGSGLTNLPAGQLTGSIADARLSSNVPLKNASNTFTNDNFFEAAAFADDVSFAGSIFTPFGELEVGAADSGGAGFRMVRVAN